MFSAGHWNPELIELAGGVPVLSQTGQPSRRLEWTEVQATDPEALIVACCGFSIDRTVEDMPTLVSYPGFGKLRCTQAGRVYWLTVQIFQSSRTATGGQPRTTRTHPFPSVLHTEQFDRTRRSRHPHAVLVEQAASLLRNVLLHLLAKVATTPSTFWRR